jgi:transposase
LINSEILLGLPDYQITGIEWKQGGVRLSARYSGPIACPNCGSQRLRSKGRYQRLVRHENWGLRHCLLVLELHKWQCRDCARHFRQRLPGIQPCQRASAAYQRLVFRQHLDGINRSRLARSSRA